MSVSYLTYAYDPCQFGYCCDGRPNPAVARCRICGDPMCEAHRSEEDPTVCLTKECNRQAALEREEAESAASDALCAQLAASIEQAKERRNDHTL